LETPAVASHPLRVSNAERINQALAAASASTTALLTLYWESEPHIIFLLRAYCTFELCRRVFDLSVAVLASSAFHREQRASMKVFEITERKFVSSFRIASKIIIYAEVPFCVFTESVEPDEFVFFLR
jgi:hypothetical protein